MKTFYKVYSLLYCSTGRSVLESTAKQLNVKPTVATLYSQTRFASSAYVQWQRIVDSYKLFAEAMAHASNAMENELDPLQYQVRGHVCTDPANHLK